MYDELITVKDYIASLKEENEYNTMAVYSAADYAAEIREQAIQSQAPALITVEEYVKSLNNTGYTSTSDKAIEEKIEKQLASSKSEKEAKMLEKLFA